MEPNPKISEIGPVRPGPDQPSPAPYKLQSAAMLCWVTVGSGADESRLSRGDAERRSFSRNGVAGERRGLA